MESGGENVCFLGAQVMSGVRLKSGFAFHLQVMSVISYSGYVLIRVPALQDHYRGYTWYLP